MLKRHKKTGLCLIEQRPVLLKYLFYGSNPSKIGIDTVNFQRRLHF